MSCPRPLVPGSARERAAAPLTLEEIDSLIAVVAVRGEGEGRIDAVRDAFKALGDVAWVPGVQGSIIKAPVLAALGGCGIEGGSGGWVQHPPGVGLPGGASGCWKAL